MPEPLAVVFDMGGVLVELGPISDMTGTQHASETFWTAWLASDAVRDFEMGRATVEEFATRFVAEADLAFSAHEFAQRFREWPKGLYDGAAAMVQSVRERCVTAVLSNTNALHWDEQRDAATMQGLFDRRYLSYELGLAKPDRDMFEHVVADLGVAPERVLFLDDNEVNVLGAKAVGIDAVLVRGVPEARSVLQVQGLLP